MNILFLRGFNNYFNRIVKKYSTLQDYKDNSTSNLVFTNINFNPNDGVATELIIGSPDQKEAGSALDWENIGTPDYCVCYEGDPVVIRSRWFVLESERTRKGQYRLALKRDVLAEHFDRVMEAPCFVEKGFVNDVDSSLLYNKENMTFNQIKQSETLLKDETGCGWIVGYVSQDAQNYPANTGEAQPNWYKSVGKVAGTAPSDTIDITDVSADVRGLINTTMYYDDLATINDSGVAPFAAEVNINSGIEAEFECTADKSNMPIGALKTGHFKYYDTTFKSLTNISTQGGLFVVDVNVNDATGQCEQTALDTTSWGQLCKFSIDDIRKLPFSGTSYPVSYFRTAGTWSFLRGITKLLTKVNCVPFKTAYFTNINKTYVPTTKIKKLTRELAGYNYITISNRLYKIVREEEIITAPDSEYYDILDGEELFTNIPGSSNKSIKELIAENITDGDSLLEYKGQQRITQTIENSQVLEAQSPMVYGEPIIKWRYRKYKREIL